MTICDWDQESYCVVSGCGEPATHERLTGFVDEVPVFDLVCCQHDQEDT